MLVEIVEPAKFNVEANAGIVGFLDEVQAADNLGDRYEVQRRIIEDNSNVSYVAVYDRLDVNNIYAVYDENSRLMRYELMPQETLLVPTREVAAAVQTTEDYLDRTNKSWREQQDPDALARAVEANCITRKNNGAGVAMFDAMVFRSKPDFVEWVDATEFADQLEKLYGRRGDAQRFLAFCAPYAYSLDGKATGTKIYLFDRLGGKNLYCRHLANGKRRYYIEPVRSLVTPYTDFAYLEIVTRGILTVYADEVFAIKSVKKFDPFKVNPNLVMARGNHVATAWSHAHLPLPELK